jgi:hypothetical protein
VTTAQARIGELGPSTVPLHPITNTGRLLDVGLPGLRRIALDVTCAGIRAADPAAAVDLDEAIARNDAYPAFRQLGNLKVTGPTAANVSDLWTIVIGPQRTAGGAGGLS